MMSSTESKKIAISMKNVEFTYPKAPRPTLIIKEFDVFQGQRLFIYGPSGSGKTTFLEVLSGVLVPEKGTISVLGDILSSMNSVERDQFRALKMSYIFQNFNLLPYLRVKENMTLPLKLRGVKVEAQDVQGRIYHLSKELGLEEFLEKPITELSTGQQQRVAVARALLSKPQILFADEPTSSLDYDNREIFLKILFDLSAENGTTILFVSHDRSLESLFERKISFLELNQASVGGKK